jgi:hypothetical protein
MTPTAELPFVEHNRRLADWLSKNRRGSRGETVAEAERDWLEAERILKKAWARQRALQHFEPDIIAVEDYVREKLGRRYLAIEATAEPEGLASELGQLSSRVPGSPAVKGHVLTVLDGAPEYARHCFVSYPGNGALAAELEAKDGPFYELCYHTFSLHGGILLSEGETPAPKRGKKIPPRKYQDGCAVVFAQPLKAIAAALHLARALAAFNEEENKPLFERLHCRVAVGSSWGAAIRCVPKTYRGEIVIDPVSWASLGDGKVVSPAQELLFAAGVRIGPSN